jgi:hypothetical protein
MKKTAKKISMNERQKIHQTKKFRGMKDQKFNKKGPRNWVNLIVRLNCGKFKLW